MAENRKIDFQEITAVTSRILGSKRRKTAIIVVHNELRTTIIVARLVINKAVKILETVVS